MKTHTTDHKTSKKIIQTVEEKTDTKKADYLFSSAQTPNDFKTQLAKSSVSPTVKADMVKIKPDDLAPIMIISEGTYGLTLNRHSYRFEMKNKGIHVYKARLFSYQRWVDEAGDRKDPGSFKEACKIMKNLECGPLVRKYFMNAKYKHKVLLERLEELNDLETLLKIENRGLVHRLRLNELHRKYPIEYYQLEKALDATGKLKISEKSHLWKLFFGTDFGTARKTP